ncbi:MAG: DUF4252 domain-containing protein [Muribaculaceae bacterium]|nr:DUF4252 domain-containing protein [Muribaculaceae bacterium]MDE6753959.1 DUF4252 domain-containing protein [Muribaculaceae bacterium]
MKKTLSIFLAVLIGILTAAAGKPAKYFDYLSSAPGFDYTYVSPSMLKMMGNKVVNTDLNIRASDISSIETITTMTEGTNTDLWESIRKLKSKMNLSTLTTKKQDNYRYDVLAKLSGDGKFITKLMVVTQDTGENVTVVYIEGKIPLDDVFLQL